MKVTEAIINVLDRCRFDGPRLYLPEQLDRPAYLAVAKIIEAAGGKWNRATKAHVFAASSAAEAIDPIVLTGEVVDAKTELGAFWTPPALADALIFHARIEPGSTILEPSAGTGRLIDAVHRAYPLAGRYGVPPVYSYEIDTRHLSDLCFKIGSKARIADFLRTDPVHYSGPTYDRIIMNPPFARQTDIDHVRHAAQFMRPGGRLAAIMSAGIRFRENRKTADFRDWLRERRAEITDLPDDAFKESGTGVRTVMVAFDQ